MIPELGKMPLAPSPYLLGDGAHKVIRRSHIEALGGREPVVVRDDIHGDREEMGVAQSHGAVSQRRRVTGWWQGDYSRGSGIGRR